MKQCRKCGLPKPLDDFYKQADTADGFTTYCRRCLLNARKIRRQNDTLQNYKQRVKRLQEHVIEQRRDYQRKYLARKRADAQRIEVTGE